jgi:hypothetical protein
VRQSSESEPRGQMRTLGTVRQTGRTEPDKVGGFTASPTPGFVVGSLGHQGPACTTPPVRPRHVPCLDQSMTSTGPPDEARGKAELAVWFGGASLAPWLCCPFWALVCFLALPLALVGLVRACTEYHASRSDRASGPRAIAGGALSLLGASAAIAYLVFLSSHPDLPVQG